MKQTSDQRLAQLTEALARAFRSRGHRAQKQRALIRLALDFWTWRCLSCEGLDDDTAATLMSEAAASVAALKTHIADDKSEPQPASSPAHDSARGAMR